MQMSGFGWTVTGGMRKKCSLAFGSLNWDDERERERDEFLWESFRKSYFEMCDNVKPRFVLFYFIFKTRRVVELWT